jgi:osmotically-inducible protein OsmY
MSNLRVALSLVLAASLPLASGGCALVVVGGLAGAGAAGYAAGQERGVAGTVDDVATKTNVQVALLNANPPLPTNIGVTVYEGRTLLTGVVAGPAYKEEAGQLARGASGVKVVYNELQVAPGEGGWDVAQDAWISAKLRSQLTLDADIRSLNYNIETVNGTVYLIGSARSQAELDRATGWARNIPDVKRVVSFVEVRPGAPTVATQPGPGPASAEAGEPPAAAPTVPVESQRL